jgi:transcriptional regulator with XRE-family HTH domain
MTEPTSSHKVPSPKANDRLRAERVRRRLTQRDVAEALTDLAWRQLGTRLGVDAGMVSK